MTMCSSRSVDVVGNPIRHLSEPFALGAVNDLALVAGDFIRAANRDAKSVACFAKGMRAS
ncbi:MAG TPA: hypothetical protein VFK22_01115 [Candidatus Dormibacteraeota bacterium]|nr:hypothetical protein [Candidatus Dormibacteraeota bacterium]